MEGVLISERVKKISIPVIPVRCAAANPEPGNRDDKQLYSVGFDIVR